VQPVFAEDPGEFNSALKVGGFDEKRIGAKRICAIYIADLIRRGQNDGGNVADSGLLANPFKHLKAVDFGHLQVEEDQIGKRVFTTAGVLAFGGEILNCFFAIPDDLQRIGDECLLECTAYDLNIVFSIFGEKDDRIFSGDGTHKMKMCRVAYLAAW
jgi:hypothetical protein